MILQRSENLQFKTIRGVLVTANQEGYSHILVDDGRKTYLIESSRKTLRMDGLIGTRVEIKGLVDSSQNARPKVHVLHYAPADSYVEVLQ
jgi:hypothetical protein